MARFVFYDTPPELVTPILALKAEIAALQFQRAAHRLLDVLTKHNFNPAQPRVPAGNSDGGRWTDAGGGLGDGYVRVAVNDRGPGAVASDASSATGDKTLGLTSSGRETSRRKFVLQGGGTQFFVSLNSSANAEAPWYERPEKSMVAAYNDGIEYIANREQVDADLIRAIMYVETTHGWYDELSQPLQLNDTILPMNVSVTKWGSAFNLTRDDLEKPFTNIEAGVRIIKGIEANLPARSPVSVIATLYNRLGATKVTDYGARVAAVYKLKPW